jgi:hypothetical protein
MVDIAEIEIAASVGDLSRAPPDGLILEKPRAVLVGERGGHDASLARWGWELRAPRPYFRTVIPMTSIPPL